MYNLHFRTRAYKNIQDISKMYHDELLSIDQGFSDLEKNGLSSSNIKSIGRIKGELVYRKRVGRWRLVFMIKEKDLDIFLIEIEKDTSKDYNDRLDYVMKSLRLDNK